MTPLADLKPMPVTDPERASLGHALRALEAASSALVQARDMYATALQNHARAYDRALACTQRIVDLLATQQIEDREPDPAKLPMNAERGILLRGEEEALV